VVSPSAWTAPASGTVSVPSGRIGASTDSSGFFQTRTTITSAGATRYSTSATAVSWKSGGTFGGPHATEAKVRSGVSSSAALGLRKVGNIAVSRARRG
jgi:hypothetical protein